jgi:hypothetical protein
MILEGAKGLLGDTDPSQMLAAFRSLVLHLHTPEDSLRASLPRVERYLNYDRPVAAHGLAKHDRV